MNKWNYLVQDVVQELHVLRLALDGVGEEHVRFVRNQPVDGRLLHTCKPHPQNIDK